MDPEETTQHESSFWSYCCSINSSAIEICYVSACGIKKAEKESEKAHSCTLSFPPKCWLATTHLLINRCEIAVVQDELSSGGLLCNIVPMVSNIILYN